MLTISQIIEKSSNVGAAKIALALKPEYFWDELHKAGFGTAPQGRLSRCGQWPACARTRAGARSNRPPWRYGNGIAVSLLQMARAYTVFANDGEMRPVTMLKQDVASHAAGRRCSAPPAARAVSAMMETVVSPVGTAPRAQVAGYRVAGKTGTAHKPEDGRYSADKYIASFIGLAPAEQPAPDHRSDDR